MSAGRRIIILAVAVVLAACSDAAAPAPLVAPSLDGTWTLTDTFNLGGTITLYDAKEQLSPAAYSDSVMQWMWRYGDTLQIVSYAVGIGHLYHNGVAAAPVICGAMLWRQWVHPGLAVAVDTTGGVRFRCGDVELSAKGGRSLTQPRDYFDVRATHGVDAFVGSRVTLARVQ